MASLMPYVFIQELDANGTAPLASGLIYSYAAGTTTPKATYTTYAGDVENANPVVLDSAGRAAIWLGSGGYKFIIKTSAGVTVDTRDNVYVNGGGTGGLTVVANMAALRALAENAASVVYMRGFYTDEDGGQGWFYWDSASTASEDYGVVIIPTTAPATGRWVRVYAGRDIDVKWFGAKGDTTTNDTTAITRADDYLYASGLGGSLIFPGGTFLMSSDPSFTSYLKILSGGVLKWSGYQLDLSNLIDAPKDKQCFSCAVADVPTLPTGIKILPVWFGATGDGTTDDTSAMAKSAAAMPSSGGSIYICAGTYMVGTLLDYANPAMDVKANSEIYGDGENTILKFRTNTGSAGGIFGFDCEADRDNVFIHDLKLDGNRANQAVASHGNGIYYRGNNVTIENVAFDNFYEHAIRNVYGSKNTVRNCSITNNAAGIYYGNTSRLTLCDNEIYMDEADDGSANYPIVLETNSIVTIFGNKIELEAAGTSTCAAITETGTNTLYEYGINHITNYTTAITTTATRNTESELNLKCLKRLVTAKGTDVASGGNLVLAANGNVFDITGTTTINGITVTDWTEGSIVTLQFDGAVTLTHNATVVDPVFKLYLLNSADYTTIAGDVIQFVYCGSIWRQLNKTNSQHSAAVAVTAASKLDITTTSDIFNVAGATQINYMKTTGRGVGALVYLIFASNPVIHENEGVADSGYAKFNMSANISTAANTCYCFLFDGTDWRYVL